MEWLGELGVVDPHFSSLSAAKGARSRWTGASKD